MSYQEYIHQKLKEMSLQEKVNAQSKQIELVHRINFNLSETNPESVMGRILKIKEDSLFKRDDLYEILDHIPNEPNKRQTGQELMMSAMYGEDSLPNGKDVLEK